MPWSQMSAASSGAVFSSAIRTPSTIVPTGSDSASAICPWLIEISLGTPLTRSRPLMWTVLPMPSTGGLAMPTSFLIRSAVASPIRRLWLGGGEELILSSFFAPPPARGGVRGGPARQHPRHFGGAAADVDHHRAD